MHVESEYYDAFEKIISLLGFVLPSVSLVLFNIELNFFHWARFLPRYCSN